MLSRAPLALGKREAVGVLLLRATFALGKRDASNTKSDGENTEALFCVVSTVDGIIVASEH